MYTMKKIKKYKALWIAGIAICFLVSMLSMTVSQTRPENGLEKLTFNGQYQEDGGQWKQLEQTSQMNAYETDEVILKGHFNRAISSDEQILFFMNYLEVHMEKDGQTFYSYGTEGSYSSAMQSAGAVWGRCGPGVLQAGEEIQISLQSKYKNNYYSAYNDFLDNLYAGDAGTLLMKLVSDNIVFVSVAVVVFILGITLLLTSSILKRKKIEIHMHILLLACNMVISSLWILVGGTYTSLIIKNGVWILLLEMTLLSLMNYLLVAYFRTLIRTKVQKLMRAAEYICLAMALLYFALQIAGIVDSYQIRAYYIPIYGIVDLFLLGAGISELRHAIDIRQKLIYMSVVAAGIAAALELLNYAVELLPKGMTITVGILFIVVIHFVLSVKNITESVTRMQRAAQMEKELAESRTAIMLSQIQPHFLYNALNTICHLCNTQPKLAGKTVERFAKYLRGNMDSLKKKTPVPFQRELAHLENYLSIEQLRFKKVMVKYDLETTNFSLPALTIQPIVENSIKYGLVPKVEGGTVTIQTYRDKKCFYVRISDDGVGFDPYEKQQDGRSHIGIENTRARIAVMCRGSLEIESKKGEGTTVVISIPVKAEM